MWFAVVATVAVVTLLAVYDRRQRKHAVISNFPIIGRIRYWFEALGGPLRQYIVTSNDEERPFSRDQRRWVYASAKHENNYFGYGTDNDLEQAPNYVIVRHSAFPLSATRKGEPGFEPLEPVPCGKVLGGFRRRAKAFRPRSIVNTSAMSYGSLSGPAVEAINRGVALAGALQNTGEGGISEHHRHGGELIWQIGTGYFGCRTTNGRFSLERFLETLSSAPVRAIEIKLSQGAKPGLGGVLPAAKVTPEIARIRLIELGRDCISPSAHSEFNDVSSLLDFIEQLADASGLPVGIKSAVGDPSFWGALAKNIDQSGRAPDFITIDGGEGGTGAAPLVFADHVAMPFKLGFSAVYKTFVERGLQDKLVFIGSGRLGFPAQALLAFGLGCDLVHVAREAMLAIGCIQAQQCHTGRCPTGVATQDRWLMGGLDPTDKATRVANYLVTLRKELLQLAYACGVPHPALVPLDRLELLDGFKSQSAREIFGYEAGWGLLPDSERSVLENLMRGRCTPAALLALAPEPVAASAVA